MKLVSIRLLTSDVTTAIPFWRDILGLRMTYSDETMGYAYFETSTVGVELYSRDGHATALGATTPPLVPAGHQAVITFQVDDVDAAYAEAVARGAQPVAPPQDRPAWYARTAHLAAHDGYLVELYSRLS
jgi:lactoylglutathione lyase